MTSTQGKPWDGQAGGTIEIPMSCGLVGIIDEEDAGIVSGLRCWVNRKTPSCHYVYVRRGGADHLLHRLIMKAGPSQIVDGTYIDDSRSH